MKNVNIKLYPKQHKMLKLISDLTDKSIQDVVHTAIIEHLKTYNHERLIEETYKRATDIINLNE